MGRLRGVRAMVAVAAGAVHRAVVGTVIGGVIGVAGPAPAAASIDYADQFNFYFGGIKAGEMDVAMDFEAGRYRAATHVRATGLVGAIVGGLFRATAAGRAGENRAEVDPERFTAFTEFSDDQQAVDVTFADRSPSRVVANPPFKDKSYAIEAGAQRDVIDPVSAAVALIAPRPANEICGRSYQLFDGRKRADIVVGEAGEDLVCKGVWTRVAGYRAKDMKDPSYEFRIEFEPWRDGLVRVRRIAIPIGFGTAVLLRK